MRYKPSLVVAGEPVTLVSHDVRLKLSGPGTAQFVVQSKAPLSGPVLMTLGLNDQQHFGQFLGYIERCTRASSEHYLLFCREKSAQLVKKRVPVALRNKTLSDLLTMIAAMTGLKFALGSGSYANTPVPYFFNSGSGAHIMQRLAAVFSIDDYIWQQRRDGRIFVGSWADSHYPGQPITLTPDLLHQHTASESAEMLAIPGLRPGAVLNGHRLNAVQLKGPKMNISWESAQ